MRVSSLARSRTVLIVASLVLLIGLVVPVTALAAEVRSANQVVVGPTEVVADDLYAFGNTVTIDGTVKGDLVTFATQVTINGTVEGDVLALSQALVINGTVGDDVRAAGQVIMLDRGAQVADDAVIGSLSLESRAGSTMGGDLLFGAAQARLAGNVDHNVRGAASAVALDGTVGRDVTLEVGGQAGGPQPALFMPPAPVPMPAVQPGLTLGDSARVGGRLTYQSPVEGKIAPAAQVPGGVSYEPVVVAPAREPTPVSIALDHLRRLVTLLLVGLLMMWVAPAWTTTLGGMIQSRPLASLGWGVVALVVFPVVVITLAVVAILLAIAFGRLTLGGLVGPLVGIGLTADAVLVTTFLIFTGFVAQIVVSVLGGHWLLNQLQPALAASRVWPLVAGLIVLVILTAIPWLGFLVTLVVSLLGLGALWLWTQARLRPTSAAVSAGEVGAGFTYAGAT
ncbi:MAG: polymer-forming cytoskeletal protein [Ardenticatenaceae bacterium]|nr:polymer-forming cytoskeletal protein [Ardenticatenaceae bacterium]